MSSSESTLVKMPHRWKSHVTAQMILILDTVKQVLWKTLKNPDEMQHKTTLNQCLHCWLR